MAKDPAFLFYSSDFLTGTMTLSDEQVGKYIRLLCLQHQTGRLTEKHMLNICKTYDKDIFDKFVKDSDGTFYNKRLEEESVKRKNYSESRAKNRLHKTKEKITYVKHMENENVNEDININGKENKNKNPELVFPFSSEQFLLVWGELCKEKKWRNKSHRALQASLRTISKYSEQDAIAMIEQAIAGEYQGLHPVNNKSYGKTTAKESGTESALRAVLEINKPNNSTFTG